MAKKKITGTSKLADVSAPSPSPAPEDTAPKKLNLVPKKVKLMATSFRLTPEDKDRLKGIVQAVNELSPNKKISESLIIKALLYQGANMNPDKVFELVRKVIL